MKKQKSEKENNKTISIEESFNMLDKIIDEMDNEKCPIEKSLTLYEKGIDILNDVSKKIDKVEKEVEVLEGK